MASDRDTLAQTLKAKADRESSFQFRIEHYQGLADEALAAGWRPPTRTVSEEEANRLLPGAIVRRGGKAWEREHGLWWHGGLLDGYAVPYGSAPITVLYDPAEENDDAH